MAWWLGSFLLPENEDSGVPTRKYMGAFGGIPENMSNLWQLGKYAHRRQDRTDGSSGECSRHGALEAHRAHRGEHGERQALGKETCLRTGRRRLSKGDSAGEEVKRGCGSPKMTKGNELVN